MWRPHIKTMGADHGQKHCSKPCAGSACHTQFQDAACGTIRLKLLKLGAKVTVSVRRIEVAIASVCPYRTEVRARPSAPC